MSKSESQRGRIAVIHDWLTGMRGGEYVLEAILEIFPEAEIFTLFHVEGSVSEKISAHRIHASWLNGLPFARKKYRHFLPLMPKAVEGFDLRGFDLLISSSHCVAKGIRKPPHALHISYVHAPMRYIWDRFEDYFGKDKASFPVRLAANALRSALQRWDRKSSRPENVDLLIANSEFIAMQIQRAYQRQAMRVYPFADLTRFNRARTPGREYLVVSAFAPYKRIDLAIEVFNKLRLPLRIVGSGQEERRLREMAGPTIIFHGGASNTQIDELYSKARAFVFPGKEDFGITPVEAMAAGCPVIAFAEGGAAETVTEKSGVFFQEQTPQALEKAVLKIENQAAQISEEDCRQRASHFSKARFQREFLAAIEAAWKIAGRDMKNLIHLLEKSTPKALQAEFLSRGGYSG